MTFIVNFIALLIERFFDWSHLRHWQWFYKFQQAIIKRLPTVSPYIILGLSILPLLLVIGAIQIFFDDMLYGLLKLIFQLLILLYCLGPQNLWADGFACINALAQGEDQLAADKLHIKTGPGEINYKQSLHRHLLNTVFIETNSRIFAVIFWYVVLGPIGAMLYRCVNLSAPKEEKEVVPGLANSAHFLELLLDWIPIRILTFLFALGGHFTQVMNCWRKRVFLGLESSEAMLTDCGAAALGVEDQAFPEDGTAEKNAINLIDRSLVIWLVVIAIGVLVF